jgi:hypothetical protein
MQFGERYRLGESIELMGYSLPENAIDGGRIQPGQEVTVTLHWQALDPLVEDYTVFVHLLDEAGQVRAQHDGRPVNGRYPTHSWLPNQIVQDETVLVLDSDLQPGAYRISVGMYELETGRRLEVKGREGTVPNNAILLGPVLQVEKPR